MTLRTLFVVLFFSRYTLFQWLSIPPFPRLLISLSSSWWSILIFGLFTRANTEQFIDFERLIGFLGDKRKHTETCMCTQT